MRRKTIRIVLGLALLAILAMGATSLFAKPGGKGFLPCPWPPCMMACQFPPQPEVLCKDGKNTFETSFACCCCGGGRGTKYKRL